MKLTYKHFAHMTNADLYFSIDINAMFFVAIPAERTFPVAFVSFFFILTSFGVNGPLGSLVSELRNKKMSFSAFCYPTPCFGIMF